MAEIRIQERTPADDIVGWDLRSSATVRLLKRSGFEPGAQGLALSALAAIRLGTTAPKVECDFAEPTSVDALIQTPFASAFGFALTRLSSALVFEGRTASASFKRLLSEYYKRKRGVLGTGQSYSVVCADPVFALPPALGVSAAIPSPESFPPPSAFYSLLNSVVRDLGFRSVLVSSVGTGITSFVYEALRNSLEHGITQDAVRKTRSTRALIVEKIVLQNFETPSKRFSDELNDYVERIKEAHRDDLGLGVLCLTVVDQGDGIQSTLPIEPGEDAGARLARAFRPGESRKPQGMVSRGLGLPSIVSAAHHLRALVRITSGDLVVGQDFSLSASKYPEIDFQSLRKLPDNCVCGTSISVFVPEYAFDVDQVPLFGR